MGDFIKEQNNIFLFPDVEKAYMADASSQITIGDLHSNAIKLLFVLLKHGIAEGITSNDYQELISIYLLPAGDQTSESIQTFDAIIAKLRFRNIGLLRLIGDELADRGNNDYFVLSILDKLYQEKVPVEILLSNHGIEFVGAVERHSEKLLPQMLIKAHAQSLFELNHLIEKGLVDKNKIHHIYKTAYSHFLKLLSYSLNDDDSEITIYSHAPCGMNSIRALAVFFKVTYDDTSPVRLAATIDQINDEFKKRIISNSVYSLCDAEVLSRAYNSAFQSPDPEKNPIDFVIWNRIHNKCEWPELVNHYKVFFAHGHDMGRSSCRHVVCLDNNFGKPGLHRGLYTAIYSHDHALRPCYPLPTPWIGGLFSGVISTKTVDNSVSNLMKTDV